MNRSIANTTIRLIVFTGACVSVGCSFVQLSDAGANVVQAQPADIINCDYKGEITTTTREKVVVKRGSGKVQEELAVLARNDAAKLGANAIVPQGSPTDGTQKYRAYRCS